MIPHFMLNRGNKEYLIIRMDDVFHIIDADEHLTKEKRAAILEKGCTPAEMQQMGLSGMTIPKSDIKSLTVTGCGYMDDVIFRLNRQKLAFWFPQAYEQRKVDDFFRGIPRKQYKTRHRVKGGKHRDWRMREQNYELYCKLRPVGWVWNILCAGIVLIPLLTKTIHVRHLGWIITGMSLFAILLDIFMPEYFTIIWIQNNRRLSNRKYGQRELKTRAINLGFGLSLIVGFFVLLCSGGYHLFDPFRVLPPALIATAIVSITLLLFAREFQEQFSAWLVSLLLILFFNIFAFVPHFNHVLGPDLSPVNATIVDQHKSSGAKRGTNYYCTVTLPDGRELDVKVSREEYDALAPGDTIDLQVGTGFFGIDYAIDG